ncbi:MAG: hypothetical protein WB984_08145, partial [Thermoplasmata archaeon]
MDTSSGSEEAVASGSTNPAATQPSEETTAESSPSLASTRLVWIESNRELLGWVLVSLITVGVA